MKQLFIGLSVTMCLAACQSTSTDLENSPTPLSVKPVNCSAPPLIENIWKLEPMLKDKGLITDAMNKEQKEQVIREYIRKKNSKFENCSKGK